MTPELRRGLYSLSPDMLGYQPPAPEAPPAEATPAPAATVSDGNTPAATTTPIVEAPKAAPEPPKVSGVQLLKNRAERPHSKEGEGWERMSFLRTLNRK
jgi:hypothetical protein